MASSFTPTRTAALERLAAFLPKAGRGYAARRNFDLGAGRHAHVSGLSPYLRYRLITEEEVLRAVIDRHGLTASEKFVQEVFWRTYWKGWLEMRPGVWENYQTELSRVWNDVQTQSGLRTQWEAACRGETEIDCFNAWAQELVSTGYLHNHARMWFASIWIFTLRLPWVLGADFFLRHLLDGDPASNTLGWRWVAGIQTQGKTYLARTSNIAKFTEGRFHPKWQLAGTADPLSAPAPPAPQPLPAAEQPTAGRTTGLLLHEEDLNPEFLIQAAEPVASAVLRPQTTVGPLQSATQVTDFRGAALQDAAARWDARIGPQSLVANVEDIRNWARIHDLQQILCAHAPTGPVAKLITDLRSHPDAPPVVAMMRPYDQMTWPHATKGFFPFKKNIPDFIFNLSGNRAA